jgi:hypothetical protein
MSGAGRPTNFAEPILRAEIKALAHGSGRQNNFYQTNPFCAPTRNKTERMPAAKRTHLALCRHFRARCSPAPPLHRARPCRPGSSRPNNLYRTNPFPRPSETKQSRCLQSNEPIRRSAAVCRSEVLSSPAPPPRPPFAAPVPARPNDLYETNTFCAPMRHKTKRMPATKRTHPALCRRLSKRGALQPRLSAAPTFAAPFPAAQPTSAERTHFPRPSPSKRSACRQAIELIPPSTAAPGPRAGSAPNRQPHSAKPHSRI